MTIRIGIREDKNVSWEGELTHSELGRLGIVGELLLINATHHPGNATKALEDALSRGEIDVAVHPMQDLSTKADNQLVITAVSKRDNPADCLVIRQEAYAGREIFRLKQGAKVAASGRLREAQLLDIRPDIQFQANEDEVSTLMESLRAGAVDALMMPVSTFQRLNIDLPDIEIVELNPREFIPAPAQGVVAWQCHADNLPLRRIFRDIHHPEVSACTSVERRVLQIMGENLPLGVYCERDAAGNYHCFAACETDGSVRRKHLSSSTSFGMSEKLAVQLKAEF